MSEARQRYYLAHREQITTKMRERYDPEHARTYYESNKDRIRARQKLSYIVKAEAENKNRIKNLITFSDPIYHPFLESLLCQIAALTNQDITGLEKCVLLAGKMKAPVVITDSEENP